MRRIVYMTAIAVLSLVSGAGCFSRQEISSAGDEFVSVRDGKFYLGDSAYNYIGTNFWYGAILACEGRGGDRARLVSELDALKELGVTNLRVLAGGDGQENVPSHIMPVLQTAPGVYNDTILDGLDFLMAELAKRDMKAVIYLNNAWEWSGGYGTYLEWAGHGPTPNPSIDGYHNYMRHVAQFVRDDSAKALAANHVRNMVTRVNRYTGVPYSEAPELMSWQIANEPRAFASDSATKEAFAGWIASQAALIKSLDSRHLVSTGSEGLHGCEGDLELWRRIHSDPNIDYAIIHLWPYNWGWVRPDSLLTDVESAFVKATDYIGRHTDAISSEGKPLVLEEFGFPRDGMAYAPGSPTEARDRFYDFIFSLVRDNDAIGGCNFWGWGGYAVPAHDNWQPWDPYTGDPAQEAQGLNSVFMADSSTIEVIRSHTKR